MECDLSVGLAEGLCAAGCDPAACDVDAQSRLIAALCPDPDPELIEGCLAEAEALSEGSACELAPELPACDAACGWGAAS